MFNYYLHCPVPSCTLHTHAVSSPQLCLADPPPSPVCCTWYSSKFSESINVEVEGLCYLDTLVRVCSPPVIRTESSSSDMAQASLQIFIDIRDVRD